MKKFSCFLKNSRKVKSMIFIPAANLIINVLASKSEIEQKRIAKVSTDLKEIEQVSKYISKKIINRIVFENSYKKILATMQLYPHQFILNNETGEISLSPSYMKNRRKLKEIYTISREITKCFRDFFKEKKIRQNIKEQPDSEHIMKKLHTRELEYRIEKNTHLNALTPKQLKTRYQ